MRTRRPPPFSLLIAVATALSCLCLSPGPTAARIIHVPADSATIQGGIQGAAGGDTVLVAPGAYLEHGIDFLGRAITVTGTDPEDSAVVASTVVDARDLGGVFVFRSGEEATSILTGLTITGGSAEDGGGILCDGTSPTLSRNVITRNNASSRGGGVFLTRSVATLADNVIASNSADEGGGVCADSASPVIDRNAIVENRADGTGGGISCTRSSPVIRENLIRDNEAAGTYGHGGGIYAFSSTSLIADNVIIGNSAQWSGGGITASIPYGSVIRGCTIEGNSTGRDGGGIECASAVSMTIEACEITANIAHDGAGIEVHGGTPSIRNCTIEGNSADGGGGGILVQYDAASLISHCRIAGNSAAWGGGVRIYDDSHATIFNSVIAENDAEGGGGISAVIYSAAALTNVTVAGNTADDGGGIYAHRSTFTVRNSIVRENAAPAGPQIWLGGWNDDEPSFLEIRYSDVEGGRESVEIDDISVLYWGEGMIDADARFVAYHGFDRLLGPGSPCIDAGDPSLEDGVAWPEWYANGPRSDMGAYGGPADARWLTGRDTGRRP